MILLCPEGAPPSADPIRDIFNNTKTIAVVGLSSKPYRPSFEVSAYLLRAGYRIVPVNPLEAEVHGLRAYASVDDVPGEVDVVEVFRKSEDVPPVAEGAIRKRAKVLWLQQGIVNEDVAKRALAAGLTVVMDACMLVEHRRLEAPKPL